MEVDGRREESIEVEEQKGENQMNLSRRSWLKATSATGAGLLFLPSRVFGANERINVAFIGVGGRGSSAVGSLRGRGDVNLVAFADVDRERAASSFKANPDVPRYKDFRVMLDECGKDIDAVAVSTPDHTHHHCAATCLEAGKHVFVEKPLAHSIAEVRDLAARERSSGLACQMGNQGHSGGGILILDAWIRQGVLGDIREVHAWVNSSRSTEDRRPPAEAVPEGLDWNQWLGPATEVPFSSRYVRASWRDWFAFGTGSLGDWFCHNADAPFLALGLDCPKKVEIEGTGPKKLSFPDSARVTFTFDRPEGGEIKLFWYQGKTYKPPRPPEMEPGKEMGNSAGGTMVVGSKATAVTASHAGTPQIVPFSRHREMQSSLPKPDLKRSGHMDNWLKAIRGEEKTRSNFAYSARLTEAMHYGNIAMHVNRAIRIDTRKREIVGDEEAAKFMDWPPPRKGWSV